MSKEKQIEEMARLLESFCELQDECSCIADCDECRATKLYEAGYRKQSVGGWMTHHCTNGGTSQRGRTIIYKTFTCDRCGKSNGRHKTNYCPNCGAKMKGGE